MKSFFEEYGFVALTAIAIIILIVMTTAVGDAIKQNLNSLVNSFGLAVLNQTANTKVYNL